MIESMIDAIHAQPDSAALLNCAVKKVGFRRAATSTIVQYMMDTILVVNKSGTWKPRKNKASKIFGE